MAWFNPLTFSTWEDARRGRSSRRRMNVLWRSWPASGPFQFLETPRVECSLWPTLYWCTDMCETVERATDAVDALPGMARSARRKKWRNSTAGWKVPSCAVDDCPSFLQPEPFSCRSWKTWALVGLKASFFCLPQAGAQLQVFDGDAAEGNSTNLATAMCLPDAANWWKAISLPGQLFRCAGYSQPQKNKSQTRSSPGT